MTKLYETCKEIWTGRRTIAVLIACAQILADNDEHIKIAIEQNKKTKLTREQLLSEIEDCKITILAHHETAQCCDNPNHKHTTAKYQIAMTLIRLISTELQPDISLDALKDKFNELVKQFPPEFQKFIQSFFEDMG